MSFRLLPLTLAALFALTAGTFPALGQGVTIRERVTLPSPSLEPDVSKTPTEAPTAERGVNPAAGLAELTGTIISVWQPQQTWTTCGTRVTPSSSTTCFTSLSGHTLTVSGERPNGEAFVATVSLDDIYQFDYTDHYQQRNCTSGPVNVGRNFYTVKDDFTLDLGPTKRTVRITTSLASISNAEHDDGGFDYSFLARDPVNVSGEWNYYPYGGPRHNESWAHYAYWDDRHIWISGECKTATTYALYLPHLWKGQIPDTWNPSIRSIHHASESPMLLEARGTSVDVWEGRRGIHTLPDDTRVTLAITSGDEYVSLRHNGEIADAVSGVAYGDIKHCYEGQLCSARGPSSVSIVADGDNPIDVGGGTAQAELRITLDDPDQYNLWQIEETRSFVVRASYRLQPWADRPTVESGTPVTIRAVAIGPDNEPIDLTPTVTNIRVALFDAEPQSYTECQSSQGRTELADVRVDGSMNFGALRDGRVQVQSRPDTGEGTIWACVSSKYGSPNPEDRFQAIPLQVRQNRVLVLDSNNDGIAGSSGDEEAEFSPDRLGALLPYNDDDDDDDGVPDFEDDNAPGEDDLEPLLITLLDEDVGLAYRLEALEGHRNVRAWTTAAKGTEVEFPAEFGPGEVPEELFLEGVLWNDSTTVLALHGFAPDAPETYLVADTVQMYVGTVALGLPAKVPAGEHAVATVTGLPPGHELLFYDYEYTSERSGGTPVVMEGLAASIPIQVSQSSWENPGSLLEVIVEADGGRLSLVQGEFVIVPGPVALIESNQESMGSATADGSSPLLYVGYLYDAFGNAVADSLPVSLVPLFGTSASPDEMTPAMAALYGPGTVGYTEYGRVEIPIPAPYEGVASVRPMAGGFIGDSLALTAAPLTGSLTATTDQLDVLSAQTSTLTLQTNASAGTQVRWAVSSVAPGAPSTFTTEVGPDGTTTLDVSAQGAPVGFSVVTATVGARVLTHVLRYHSSGPLSTEVMNRLIAGDVPAVAGSDAFGWREGFALADGATSDGGSTPWSTAGPALSAPTQTTLYEETFALADGATADSGPTPWTLQAPGDAAVQGGRLRFGVTGQAYWTSGIVDLSPTSGPVRIEVDAAYEGDHKLGDELTFEYRLGGGAWTLFDECRDDFLVCQGRLSEGPFYTASAEGLAGSTLEIRVGALNSRDAYFLDRVAVTYAAAPAFGVEDGRFVARDFSGTGAFEEREWQSGPIDISGGPVDLSLVAGSFGRLETDDSFVAAYRLNGGPEVVFGEQAGGFLGAPNPYSGLVPHEAQGLSINGLDGQTLELVVRTRMDEAGEGYTFDDVSVQRAGAPEVEAWTAAFDALPNGATSGGGNPAWTLDASRVQGGTFAVAGGRFEAANTDGVGLWSSGPIDISDGVATLAFVLQAQGQLAPHDWVRASYRVDGAAPVLVAERAGRFNGRQPEAFTVKGLVGERVELDVQFFSAVGGRFSLDDVRVTTTAPQTWALRVPYRYEAMVAPPASLGGGPAQVLYGSDMQIPVGTEVVVRGAPNTEYTFSFLDPAHESFLAIDGLAVSQTARGGEHIVMTDTSGTARILLRSEGAYREARFEAVQFKLALRNGSLSWKDEVYLAPQDAVGHFKEAMSEFFGGGGDGGSGLSDGIITGAPMGTVIRNVWHMTPWSDGDVDQMELALALAELGIRTAALAVQEDDPGFVEWIEWVNGPLASARQVVGYIGDVPARVHLVNGLVKAAKNPELRDDYGRLVEGLVGRAGTLTMFREVVTSEPSYRAFGERINDYGEAFLDAADRLVQVGCYVEDGETSRTTLAHAAGTYVLAIDDDPILGCSSAALHEWIMTDAPPEAKESLKSAPDLPKILEGLAKLSDKFQWNRTVFVRLLSLKMYGRPGHARDNLWTLSIGYGDETDFLRDLIVVGSAVASTHAAKEDFGSTRGQTWLNSILESKVDGYNSNVHGPRYELYSIATLIRNGSIPTNNLTPGKHINGHEFDCPIESISTNYEFTLTRKGLAGYIISKVDSHINQFGFNRDLRIVTISNKWSDQKYEDFVISNGDSHINIRAEFIVPSFPTPHLD